jgi:hypothetical protein
VALAAAIRYIPLGSTRGCGSSAAGAARVSWIRIHWFELSTLILLALNLWFVSAVLNALRETNRWLSFLSSLEWGRTPTSDSPP